ncbi:MULTISPECIES: VOC family protein [unclassified Modicisalibacter]|uniref:VOC family protein n=1 Tax=unclassified Modicisalibacter TaxID=2679913 RepID=UPI001CC90085|nr:MULTISPECIES: VOC family protein [unclassified Modicisalibacter]MBZ9558017.1 VOC family protein [Modicisalibacter sp. R2A 31.J]MBZ9573315.1 VOC family protein [Modicisalibacter sp. MOD 31.J]
MSYQEPIHDVAKLGHAELLTPRFDESLHFFTEVYGLDVVATEGDSAYLRAWGDHDLTSLKLTASRQAGLGHVGWRAMSPQALERRVAALEASGIQGRWIDGDVGHGKAYRFTGIGGHEMELYFESEKYQAPAEKRAYLPNQPQKYHGRGAAVERIDHINLLTRDVVAMRTFAADTMGFKLREHLIPGGQGEEVGAWMSLMNKAHDLAITKEPAAGASGRLHHLAYYASTREEVLRAAEIFMENDVFIEFGPAKHSRTQGFFLYVYEPGGNRIEVFAGGFHIFEPDWEPVTWGTETKGRSTAWGLECPASFHEHATPLL